MVPNSSNFVVGSTNFTSDSAKLTVFGAISSNTDFKLFVLIQNSKKDQRKVAILRISVFGLLPNPLPILKMHSLASL